MRMDKRDQFLLNLYNQLWNSITRVEEGLWQFVGIYAGILGVHWALGKQQPALAAWLTTLASFWGINIAVNAGKWFERNRMMIIGIEKQFLNDDDLGRIIPASYHERRPRKFFTILDRVHIIVFAASIVLSLWIYWGELSKGIINITLSALLLLGGIIGTLYHWWIAYDELEKFVKETQNVGKS